MKIFGWFRKPEREPKVGEIWIPRGEQSKVDPWNIAHFRKYRIEDVQAGWVRYVDFGKPSFDRHYAEPIPMFVKANMFYSEPVSDDETNSPGRVSGVRRPKSSFFK